MDGIQDKNVEINFQIDLLRSKSGPPLEKRKRLTSGGGTSRNGRSVNKK